MRLTYIDFLKGFAIFLMVMGHFLSWTFENGLPASNMSVRIVRDIIYAFHMPLFMFMSGYVIDLKSRNFTSNAAIFGLEKKRIQTILIPSITAFVMGFLLRNGLLELPWFLTALFINTSLFCFIQWICLACHASRWVLNVSLAGGYLILFVINKTTEGSFANEFFALTQTQIMYPYFVLGYLFNHYDAYQYFRRYPIYTIALIGFCLLFYIYYFHNRNDSNSTRAILRYLLALSGITVCYELSRSINNNSSLYKWFIMLGVASLQIYLLSYYFIPIFTEIGNLIAQSVKYDLITWRSTIFIQIVSGILASVYCVVMCLITAKVIERSKLLNFLFFGKK